MKKKICISLGIVVLVIFVVYNLIWAINAYIVYRPYTKQVPKHESGIYAYHNPDLNLTYNVRFPDYLSFTGNIGVSDNDGSGLIIWPGFMGRKYEYGLRINENGTVYSIYVDESMNCISQDGEQISILERNEEKVHHLQKGLNEVWDDEMGKIR